MAAKRRKDPPKQRTRYPGIYKRGGRYVFVVKINGRQRWGSARKLTEAKRLREQWSTDLKRGEFQERSRQQFDEFARAWVASYQGNGRRGFRESTRDDYCRDLERYAIPFFGKHRLSAINPSHVNDFIAWLCNEQAQRRRAEEEARPVRKWARAVDATAESLRETEKEAEALGDDDAARSLRAKGDEAKARAKRLEKTAARIEGATTGLSDATVRRILSPVRASLGTARRQGLIRHNPTTEAALPHRPTIEEDEVEEVRALTREQLATFLGVVHSRHRLMFRFFAVTGLRVSEVFALQWHHLQLDGSTPHVKVRRAYVRGRYGPPKSRHGRRDVPLDTTMVSDLRRHRADSEWPGDDDLVFPSLNGKPLRQGNVGRRYLKPAVEEAGAPWAGFHTFRHTCASLLFQRDPNAVKVQHWLGHHSAALTLKTYTHLLDDGVGQALELAVELPPPTATPTEQVGTGLNGGVAPTPVEHPIPAAGAESPNGSERPERQAAES